MSEHRFATPGPVRLEVTVSAGSVEIVAHDGEESVVTLRGPQQLVDAARVELAGDRLIVAEPNRAAGGLMALVIGKSFDVVASVPSRSQVVVTTASGDVTLEGTFGGLEMR